MNTLSRIIFRKLRSATLLAGLVTAALCASAQTYPNKPIRIVVPAGAGNLDAIARIVAEGMSRELGQPVIVDNQPGGRQIPGTRSVATARPDGYTLLTAGMSFTVNAALYDNLPYDPVKDLTPVGIVGDSPLLVVASSNFPANNIKELIALAKTKPGVLNYASTGIGSPAHIAGELLNNMGGIKMTHIPYKDMGKANIDAVGELVSISLPSASSVIGLIKGGKLKALGMGGLKRSPQLPEIPAIAETLPGFEVSPWNGIMAPAGTPKAIITRLNTALNKAITSPDIKEKLATAGLDIDPQTPEAMGAFVNSEIKRIAKLAKAAGIQGER